MAACSPPGIFLHEFVTRGTPWAHLDIAGPAFNQWQPFGYTPKGGTGAPYRTFVRLAQELAADRISPVGWSPATANGSRNGRRRGLSLRSPPSSRSALTRGVQSRIRWG